MNRNSASIIFFILALASLGLAIIALYDGNNHNAIITGLIGLYGNLILSKIHQKD